ncbi:hypothetical protein CPB84DRAFT_887003 [Gymnopilus junonius]|uniref:Uncharacterized protein n=1 Tax=Gymnopilus junonius TaxID=109634 RepID=A0A9P5NR91_GYMJU|nr:hypothetical protein CPB84DRAFT_887003 [Gymnopilus junonius]
MTLSPLLGKSLRNWRERDLIERSMVSWVALIGPDVISLVLALLVKGLEDCVATVRETTISILPELLNIFSPHKEALQQFHYELQRLATSPNYRRRMTFVACQQILALSVDKGGQLFVSRDESSLRSVADLANDSTEGVRIGVARFAGLVLRTLLRDSHPIPTILRNLVRHLSEDSSHEVQAYVAGLSVGLAVEDNILSLASLRLPRKSVIQTATFSRPPLPLSVDPNDEEESTPDLSVQR